MPLILNKTAPLPKRGRRPADLVLIVRNWIWLGEITCRCSLSLRAMDREFLGEKHENLRAFWRIWRDGFDPGHKRFALNNKSLVELVAKKPGFADTKQIYESPLWLEVLGRSEMSPGRRKVLISMVLKRLQLYQPDATDEFICDEMNLQLLELRSCSRNEYKRSLGKLAERCSLDAILLQCLLYRQALADIRLEEAICLRDSLFRSVRKYCDRVDLDFNVRGFFNHLIKRRIISGDRDISPSAENMAIARKITKLARSEAKTASEHHEVDSIELQWAIMFNPFVKPKFYRIQPLDPPLEAYVAKIPGFLMKSMKSIQREMTASNEAMQIRAAIKKLRNTK